MRKHRIYDGILLAVAAGIYVLSNRREALFFLAGLVLIPVLAALLQLLGEQGVRLECRLPGACRAGDTIPLKITIKRNNGIPMGKLCVRMVFENLMYQETQERILELVPTETRELAFSCEVKMQDCGSVRITVPYVEYQDLLGLTGRRRKAELTREILVYPAQLDLNTRLARRPETKTTGEFYDPYRHGQDVSEMAGLRDYVPGDSLGSIHWKLSGKLDNLVVREFGSPSNYNVLILYDMMKDADGEPISNERNNVVLALTTALSYSMIELNLSHNVSRMVQGDYQTVPVYSIGTHEQMTLNLLCRPIAKEAHRGDAISYFLRSNLENEYTKMIYITPEYEESSVRQLSREMDLTVIQVREGAGTELMETGNYVVIPIDALDYREKLRNIVI